MNSARILWIILIGAVIAGSYVAGYSIGSSGAGPVGPIVGGANTFAAGYEAARQKLVQSGLVPPSPERITTLSGVVKSVEGNTIIIETSGRISPNPLDPEGPLERTITVSSGTEISARVALTSEEFQDALETFNKRSRDGEPVPPPSPFRNEPAALEDIKLTMIITVTSEEDVREATNINATHINFVAGVTDAGNPLGIPATAPPLGGPAAERFPNAQ